MRTDLAGFAALENRLGLLPVQPLTSTCIIGKSRSTSQNNGFRVETFVANYEPEDTIRGHFEFGLKYDDLNFEWLSRFFEKTEPQWIVEWIKKQPASLYARKTAFFYEWFTADLLDVTDTTATTYEDAIDSDKYLSSSESVKNKRWKILDNLPGSRVFCPLIRFTKELKESIDFNLTKELDALDEKFGADLLIRSAAWLTFNESKASFMIEKEQDRSNDIKRFASAMALFCGKIDAPLSNESLTTFQNEVLGKRALRTGIRKSPVFIGTAAHHGVTVVHYIAPPSNKIHELMDGLRDFERKTRKPLSAGLLTESSQSVVRSSAIAFAFVYIHPLADGNGRVHRLLINDTLIRDGLIPPGVILPISSTIVKSSTRRGEYIGVLESLSKRLMRKHNTDYRFGEYKTCEDGVSTDFEFDGYDDALHFWRFQDLTSHCKYMANVIKITVTENMTDEAQYLAIHDDARMRLKTVFEMPDQDADRIIRSLRENKGQISNKLYEAYPKIFEEHLIASEIIEAVMSALEQREIKVANPSQHRG